jgi:FtsP/CotA-like multicopper oxidase with cupredoxin domain
MLKQRNTLVLGLMLIVLIIALGVILYIFIGQPIGPSGVNSEQTGNMLKIPTILEDQNPDPEVADYVIDVQSGQTNFFSDKSTYTLGYNGSYLGPVIRIKTGEEVNIRINNLLGFSTTLHWHGLIVDGAQDGGPHQGIQSGESWTASFTVDQPAATLWFHPHFIGTTADQVYYGLAGLIYIDDENSESLNLPDEYGINDFPLIVQDRSFNSDGSFSYTTTMMGAIPGDTILINGTVDPYLDVNKGNIRFRILNGSNSENFLFTLSDGSSFYQIASDGGFLENPVIRSSIFLSPGERAEVVVDFSASDSDQVSLMLGDQEILVINLITDLEDNTEIPEKLAYMDQISLDSAQNIRFFELQGMGITGTINGKQFDMNRIDEEVNLNETEIWVVRNIGGMMHAWGHPFHVHGTQFRVIYRNGESPPLEEQGFKDTVYVDAGEEVVLLVRFTHPGLFMYHCHILEHEDNGMMGQFIVS